MRPIRPVEEEQQWLFPRQFGDSNEGMQRLLSGPPTDTCLTTDPCDSHHATTSAPFLYESPSGRHTFRAPARYSYNPQGRLLSPRLQLQPTRVVKVRGVQHRRLTVFPGRPPRLLLLASQINVGPTPKLIRNPQSLELIHQSGASRGTTDQYLLSVASRRIHHPPPTSGQPGDDNVHCAQLPN